MKIETLYRMIVDRRHAIADAQRANMALIHEGDEITLDPVTGLPVGWVREPGSPAVWHATRAALIDFLVSSEAREGERRGTLSLSRNGRAWVLLGLPILEVEAVEGPDGWELF